MKAVIQRVRKCSVEVDGKITGKIGHGIFVLLGVDTMDCETDADYLSEKITNLRIFEDENGKMNRSLLDIGGEILVVSQFTLLGDCRKGRRPSFIKAAPPEKANTLYEYFIESLRAKKLEPQTGVFQAMMDVSLVNSGPVTFTLESRK